MMNSYMEMHANDDEFSIDSAKKQYNSLIELVKTTLGENAFFSTSDQRHKFNGAVYDSIMIPFSLFPKKDIIRHSDEIRTAIESLKRDNKEYQDWTYAGTNAAKRIRSRVNAVMEILNRIILLNNSTHTESQNRLFSPEIKEKLYHQGYVCSFCGNQILSIDDCEVDHIIPFDLGGPTEIENAQLLHKWCNRSKGNRLQSEIDFEDDTQDDDENNE